MSFYMSY